MHETARTTGVAAPVAHKKNARCFADAPTLTNPVADCNTQIRTIRITAHELAAVRALAGTPISGRLGGPTAVRPTQQARSATKADDMLVGMLGEYGLRKHLTGASALGDFVRDRWYTNLHPECGNYGYDIPACAVDVKARRLKVEWQILDHDLLVRPHERRAGWTYVLAIVEDFKQGATVHLAGWCIEAELPDQPEPYGPLAGAFRKPANELHPLIPLNWDFFGGRS